MGEKAGRRALDVPEPQVLEGCYRNGAELAEALTDEDLEIIRRWAARLVRAEMEREASGSSGA